MTKSDVQASRNASRRCNESVLLGAGFVRVGNSCLYHKRKRVFVLSPGIGEGKNGKYWFDIRLANLEKFFEVPEADAWVLLRIVPSWFAFFSLAHIQGYMKKETQDDRAHSGKVWGFYCVLNVRNGTMQVFSKNQKTDSFDTKLLDRVGAEAALDEI